MGMTGQRIKSYFANESVQRVMTLTGVFIINWPLAPTTYFGNIFTYTDSYFKFKVGEDPSNCAGQVIAVYVVAMSLSTTVYKLAFRCLGDRGSYILSIFGFDLAVLMAYWSVQRSVFASVLTLGMLWGLAAGAGKAMSLTFVANWAPEKNVGFINALVSTTSAGPVFINYFIIKYVNPDNLPAAEAEGNRKYFNEEQLLDRVPSLFLVMAGTFFGIHVIAIFLLRNHKQSSTLDIEETVNLKTGKESESESVTDETDETGDRSQRVHDLTFNQHQKVEDPLKDTLNVSDFVVISDKEDDYFHDLDLEDNAQNETPDKDTRYRGLNDSHREELALNEFSYVSENGIPDCEKKPLLNNDAEHTSELLTTPSRLSKNTTAQSTKQNGFKKDRLNGNADSNHEKLYSFDEQLPKKRNLVSYIYTSFVSGIVRTLTTVSFVKDTFLNVFASNTERSDRKKNTKEVLKQTKYSAVSQNDSSSDTFKDETNFSFVEVLRRKEFWSLWISSGCMYLGYLVLESYYKMFGQSRIEDDHFFGAVAPCFQLSIFGGRVAWGALADVVGVKPCSMAILVLGTFSMSFFYFTPMLGKFPFLIGVCVSATSYAGMFGVYPSAVYKIFGKSHVSTIYGMATTSFVVAGFLFPVISGTALRLGGWWGVYLAAAVSNLIGLIAVAILMPKRNYN